jgi:D-alanyl-D-alanine carboxypeptidase
VASVAACSDGDDGDAASGSTTTATAAPVEGGGGEPATGVLTGDDPRAEDVARVVEDALPELDLQSVVFGVWMGDEEIARGAIDSPETPTPTAIDALVRVGQPMEAVLGTVALQLDEEGILGLDGPVGEYVPDLVNGDAITPRMLANSTSGTPDYVPNEEFQDAVYGKPTPAPPTTSSSATPSRPSRCSSRARAGGTRTPTWPPSSR